MKRFEDLTSKELWTLRKEIILNSIFVADYENSFGFNSRDVSVFFDGYLSFINELADEDGNKDLEIEGLCERYDNEDNLWGWFNCFDDFSWMRIDNEDDE